MITPDTTPAEATRVPMFTAQTAALLAEMEPPPEGMYGDVCFSLVDVMHLKMVEILAQAGVPPKAAGRLLPAPCRRATGIMRLPSLLRGTSVWLCKG
jgi:hypothetical protein